jgi:hypothetical protein
VAATKQDGRRAMSPGQITDALGLDDTFACDAREASSVERALRRPSLSPR